MLDCGATGKRSVWMAHVTVFSDVPMTAAFATGWNIVMKAGTPVMQLPSPVHTVIHMDVPVMKKKMPVLDMTPDTDVRAFKKT